MAGCGERFSVDMLRGDVLKPRACRADATEYRYRAAEPAVLTTGTARWRGCPPQRDAPKYRNAF